MSDDCLKISYRLPNEFIGFGNTWKKGLIIWAWYCWNGEYYPTSREWGYRFLGIEIIFTKG